MKLLFTAILLFPVVGFGQANRPLVVASDSMPTYVNDPGNIGMTVLLDQTAVGSTVGLSLGTFLPGANIAEHVHQGAAEILYILSGEIELVIGGRTVTAREGSAVYVPPDVPHSARVRNAIEPARVVQVYSPGGAEQRFKAWRRE